MVGLERTVVPLIAEDEFDLVSRSVILSFLISFGIVKALSNLFAGRMSDRLGRKRILVAGWLVGLPIPFLIIFAPSWSWIVFANLLLGINQGLCWSTTVIMKIDLVGPKRLGLVMGLNEFAGYLAVSLVALLTGFLAATFGLRQAPFYPGIAFAVTGLLLSIMFVRETQPYARLEAQLHPNSSDPNQQYTSHKPTFAQIFLITSWKDRALFAASQAGMVNNLNDGMVWGLVPIFLAGVGLPLEMIGLVAAVYPGVWGISQLLTGALSDRLGRVDDCPEWIRPRYQAYLWWQNIRPAKRICSLGIGTALVYSTLLAAVSDAAHP
jgi:MFS family permease